MQQVHERNNLEIVYRYTYGTVETVQLERDFLNPLEYLVQGLHLIGSHMVNNPLVIGVNGPNEASFQVELYTAFEQMLPSSKVCLFEK